MLAGRRPKTVFDTPGAWNNAGYDAVLILLLLLLSAVGLVVLYSAAEQDFGVVRRQAGFMLLGFLALALAGRLPAHAIRRWTPWFYLGGLLLMLAVAAYGVSAKGAQRWLDIPLLPRFQPSELMKWIVPLMLAWQLSRHALPPRLPQLFMSLALLAVPVALIMRQPDLGTAVILGASGLAVLFLAGLPWRYIGATALAVLAALPLLWFFVFQEYQKSRILVLLNPGRDQLGAGWSILQSKAAIGSGGLHGKGWLEGTQAHLDFLPERRTDFIIAVLAEEWGFAGVCALFSLYLAIVGRGFFLGANAPDSFGRLFAGAMMLIFLLAALVNMAMVSGLLPVVGLPLPLVSLGGSSVVSMLLGFGLVMAVCNRYERMAT